jgi:hypothetical protein
VPILFSVVLMRFFEKFEMNNLRRQLTRIFFLSFVITLFSCAGQENKPVPPPAEESAQKEITITVPEETTATVARPTAGDSTTSSGL